MKYILLILFSVNAFAYEKVVSYDQWQNTPEKRVLNLYPGFRDGASSPGWTAAPSKDVVLYIKTVAAVISRPAEQVDLQKLVNTETIGRLLFSFTDIHEQQIRDLQVTKIPAMSYRLPHDRNWCENSLCLGMHFKVDPLAKLGMAMMPHKGTSEIFAESEVLSFKGSELSEQQALDLKALSTVQTNPTSVLVDNIFWMNHAMEFGKIIGIIQADPRNPQQSIFTGAVVFAIERKWWDKGYRGANLSEIFLGHHLNTTEGLRMGFPKIVDQVFKTLAEMISH